MTLVSAMASSTNDDSSPLIPPPPSSSLSSSSPSSSLTFLLYYHYVDIPSPQELLHWHENICGKQLHLNGRIRISSEGLNGTLSGPEEAIHAYITEITKLEYLQANKIDWKISKSLPNMSIEQQQFHNLSIKVTKEVVSLDCTSREREAALRGQTFRRYHLTCYSRKRSTSHSTTIS